MQPSGVIYLAVFGWAAGAVLAYGAKLARIVPEVVLDNGERLEDVIAETVFALFVWLPIAWAFLRNQARLLATTGIIAPTVRPSRFAVLFALAAIADFAALEWTTDGVWGSGPFRTWHGGFAPILFHVSLPLLAWGALRLSLGGKALPLPGERPGERVPRYAPTPPSTPIASGPDRERVANILANLDAVAAEFPDSRGYIAADALAAVAERAEILRIRLDAEAPMCMVDSLPLSLKSNLLLYDTALADATRLAEMAQDPGARDAAARIGDKYRGGTIIASTDLGLVLEVAREARAAAAAEAGL